jgi:8-oxo-dGTP pyrophosphatase MutT (NUDIX family)
MPEITSKYIQVHIARINKTTGEYEYLVLKRADNVVPYPNMWQVVTGNIEKDEKSIETAIREVFEETGLKPLRIWTLPYVTAFFNSYDDKIFLSPVFGIIVNNDHVKISVEHCEHEWLDYQSCNDRLELPSHREAHKIFRDYILDNEDNDMYEYQVIL